jgi:hypothetical protein
MIRLGKSSANSPETFGTASDERRQTSGVRRAASDERRAKKQAKRTTLGLFSL